MGTNEETEKPRAFIYGKSTEATEERQTSTEIER
jgi:hypothetical protein